ncbi:DUF4387 domain-containing protein [Cupriavidus lacunae]|nr:DUF4387 domain-containing protein [Cupriavidus lacunae]
MATLRDIADVIRSKNSGPFEITFDVIFANADRYRHVRDSGMLNPQTVLQLYGVPESDLLTCMFFEPALAFKFTLRRHGDQGGVGERDTFGAQQHAPLMTLEVPAFHGA